MAQGDDSCSSFQLISGDGKFNARGLNDFSQKMKLSEHGLSYAVVSIIGPQSSGKSTLLNHLFHTNFKEMDAAAGRKRTTRGIWLAKATNIDPCTLIIDVEGNDSSENEDNVTFEKQSALFALAMSDVLLINMWCSDIGREQAGGRPLLRTVFQMMRRLFSRRRRTLLFVIRDMTLKTPWERLKNQLQKSIQKIYESVKLETQSEDKLDDSFDVQFWHLPHYEHEGKKFEEEVLGLSKLFVHSTTSGGLAGDQRDKLPASDISSTAYRIWEIIKENKDLDLPKLKSMMSIVRCEQILNEKFTDFVKSKVLRTMEEALRSGPVKNFGEEMTSAISTWLSEYDKEALFFDESIRSDKRQNLQDKLLQRVQPVYQSLLDHLHARALSGFQKALANEESFTTAAQLYNSIMSEFEEACKDAAIAQATWDSSNTRDKLKADLMVHITSVIAQNARSKVAAAEDAAARSADAAANARAAAAAQGRGGNAVAVSLQLIQTLTGLAGLGFNIFNQMN